MEQRSESEKLSKPIEKEIKNDQVLIHSSVQKSIVKDSCVHSKEICDECICRQLEEFYLNMEFD